jgi:hypothetical protein
MNVCILSLTTNSLIYYYSRATYFDHTRSTSGSIDILPEVNFDLRYIAFYSENYLKHLSYVD